MRSPFGEIDLIMKRGRRLVFVEVKFRTDKGIL
jgi:Holliday junction resolvase-like predicted endonuclease